MGSTGSASAHQRGGAEVAASKRERESMTTELPPLPPIPVGVLTYGEESMLHAWAEAYARTALEAQAARIATLEAALRLLVGRDLTFLCGSVAHDVISMEDVTAARAALAKQP